MDDPTWLSGRDKRVPPKDESEGHACHARRIGIDDPTLGCGPDKRVPPKRGRDKRVRPKRGRDGSAPQSPLSSQLAVLSHQV